MSKCSFCGGSSKDGIESTMFGVEACMKDKCQEKFFKKTIEGKPEPRKNERQTKTKKA